MVISDIKVRYVGPSSYSDVMKKVNVLDVTLLPSGIYAIPVIMDKTSIDSINDLISKKIVVTPEYLINYYFENCMYDFETKISNGCKLTLEKLFGVVWATRSKSLTKLFFRFIKHNYNPNLSRVDNSRYVMAEIIGKGIDIKEEIYLTLDKNLEKIIKNNKKRLTNPKSD